MKVLPEFEGYCGNAEIFVGHWSLNNKILKISCQFHKLLPNNNNIHHVPMSHLHILTSSGGFVAD